MTRIRLIISKAHRSAIPCREVALFLFIFFFPGSGLLTSQSNYLSIKHFTEEAGLVTNGINEKQSIVQDRQGFIWLGTENGLLRYDGYGFKKFFHEPGNLNSLSSSFITELLIDPDGRLLIGTNAGLDRYHPEVDSFYHLAINGGNPQDHKTSVEDLYFDSQGSLWILTRDDILQMSGENRDFISHKSKMNGNQEIDLESIKTMAEIEDGRVYWFASERNCLIEYRVDAGVAEEIDLTSRLCVDTTVQRINVVFKDSRGHILLGTDIGIIEYDPLMDSFAPLAPFRGFEINDIVQDPVGGYCIATQSGLGFLDRELRSFKLYEHEESEPYSSSRDEIQVLFIDNHENLWIGTRGHGIDKLSKKTKGFKYYYALSASNRVAIGEITCLQKWENNVYLIGTSKGLFLFDIVAQTYNQFKSSIPSLSQAYITSILTDVYGQYWVSTVSHGLFALDGEGQVLKNITSATSPIHADCISQIWSLEQDRNGNIWAGTLNGAFVVHGLNKSIIRCFSSDSEKDNLGGDAVRSIFVDSKDRIWMGTATGLNMLPELHAKPQHFQLPDYINSKWVGSKNEIGTICESSNGNLWIKTLSGILQFNPQSHEFSILQFPQGLQASLVNSLITDQNGTLWVSSMTGLWKYEGQPGKFTHFDNSDGIENSNFNSSSMLERDGHIIFCGKEGFLRFHPDEIGYNPFVPPVVFTELLLFHNPVTPYQDNSPLSQPINFSREIKLEHWQNVIGFEFSALNFTSTEDNEYAHKLDGFEENWQYVGNKNSAVYTNLSPGKYTFIVKASNNDGVWNETGTTLHIHILPPWWNTTLAYIGYILVIAGLVFLGYRFQIRRLELKHKLAIELQEARRLKDLDKSKSELYANITHEFRTPLTLISGMATQIEEDPENWLTPAVDVIKMNSANLLNLVNQMLDLSKLESGALPLKNIQGDIISYSRYIHSSFQTYALSKDIDIHFLTGMPSYNMDYDPDKYLQIISNLLSNALKFTPSGGNIYFSLNEINNDTGRYVELKVKDTGKGIGPQVHQIFERYFQGEKTGEKSAKGTGIGLALTRDLIHLMGGSIRVKSMIGQGSEFIILLPVTNSAPLVNDEIDQGNIKQQTSAFTPHSTKLDPTISGDEVSKEYRPTVLVIEDNEDVALYIKSCLYSSFNVQLVHSASEGLAQAQESVPEIILLDLQLPDMNGDEICEILKEDNRTSHIPIIILTAAADKETKMLLLKMGVDDYITKPFDKDELRQRLLNALQLRNKLQIRYKSENLSLDKITKASEKEDAFIVKFRQVIEEKIDDDNFSVTQLCREMGLSRTQLHNKVKALTGRSTSLFVRLIRLQHARRLLNAGDLNVSQVAYDVGFKDPNYFSRCFSEEFGYPPSKIPN